MIAGVVLVPYATVLLPSELAMRVQAGLIVGALIVAASGGRQTFREAVRQLPGPVRAGLGLYAGAAAWGAAAGAFAGSPLRFVTSQFLSMALLPAAALAFAVRSDLDGETFLRGVSRAAFLALVLHGAVLVVPGLAGEVPGHFGFELRNGIGAAGVAPLLLLLGLARAGAGAGPWSLAAPGAAAILCLWAQLRGAWLSAVMGSLVLLLLMARRRTRAVLLASGAALAALAVALAAASLGRRSDGPAGSPRRIDSPTSAERVVELAPTQVFDGAALQVSAALSGDRGTHLWVWTEFAGEDGRPFEKSWVEVVGAGRWVRFTSLSAAPPGARSFRAGLRLEREEGPWLVDGVGLLVVRSRVEGLARQLALRVSSLGHALVDPAADSSLAYRMAESRAVHAEWSRAGLVRRLAGLGLGATFAFPNGYLDDEGRRLVRPRGSFIHNFYLFLMFKLGLAGAAALAGLLLVVRWTARSAIALRGRGSQWLLAGATAGWLAYLLWSVTTPQIYDFRTAPLWGVLVVACCREAAAGNAAPASSVSPTAAFRPPAGLAVERLTSDAELSSLRAEWEDLLATSRSSTVALTWVWLSTWWDVFGDGRALALLTVRDPGGLLVGLAPFALVSARGPGFVRVRRLELLGSGEAPGDAICSEYLDVVARRGREREVVDAIADHLDRTWRSGWDEIVMESALGGSVAGELASAMAGRGFRSASFEMARCPGVTLPQNEDAVPALLRPATRRKLAYYARNLRKAGRVELVPCRSEADLESAMDRLIALHQKRWAGRGRRGCFASERFTAFHRRIAPLLLREGRLVLSTLTVGGTAVCAVYGFWDGTRVLGYQSGFDPGFDRRVSLGLVMYERCLREAVAKGAREWDFLRGEEAYKSHWATGSRPILRLHVWNTGASAGLSRLGLFARRAAGRVLRGTRPGGRGPSR